MTETKYRPHQTTLERVMGALNALPKFVLRLPFQTPMSRRHVLLKYTGRKSGRSYTVPVSYVEQGDTLLIPGGGAWKKTLEHGSPDRAAGALVKALRAERPDIAVLVLTAMDTPRLHAEMRALGVQHYFAKPLTLREIEHGVRAALGMDEARHDGA